MTITEDNYLDLANLIINELIGSVPLTIVLGLILIVYFGVRERLDIQAIVALCVLWTGLITAYAYNAFLLMLVIFVVAIAIYAMWPKIIKI